MARRVLIIGGGWAGCGAAMHLAGQGWQVGLFEKSGRLGGRASSFRLHQGWEVDNGQHLFLGAYARTFALLRSLGTLGAIRLQDRLEVTYFSPDGAARHLRAGRLPGPLALWQALRSTDLLGPADKRAALAFGIRAAVDLAACAFGPAPRRLESLSVADWLRQHGQTPGLVSKFWEPLCLAALNARPAEAAASGLAVVLARGFLRGAPLSCLGMSTQPLSRLLAPLPAFLEARGGKAYLSQGVASLDLDHGRVSGLVSESGKRYEADAYVLALPQQLGARLFSAPWQSALGLDARSQPPASPIVSVQLWSKRPVLKQAFGAFLGNAAEAPFHWAFDRNALQPDHPWPGHLTSLVSSEAGDLMARTRDEILDLALSQISRYFGPLPKEEITERLVLKEAHATPLFAPRPASARPHQRTAIRNLALAGDWTETGLPATLEGAVEAGIRAAKCLT